MADAIKSTAVPTVHGIVVLNPDGTSLGGGGEYNATPPTYADGDQVVAQYNENGYQLVSLASALSNLIDKITAYQATDALMNGTTALTPKFAIIDAATSGDNTIVAAVTAKKIRVLSGVLVASAAVTARFESGAGGTALTGQVQLAANGGFIIPFSPLGNFESASGSLLNLELSGAVSVDGWITYVEV